MTRNKLTEFLEFVEKEVYPSLIVTVIALFFHAYSLLTFVFTLIMYAFFALTYFLGYQRQQQIWRVVGRIGAVACTFVVFIYAIASYNCAAKTGDEEC